MNIKRISDRDLFIAMAEAQEELDKLEEEYIRRGLNKKPFVEFSSMPNNEPLDERMTG